jgi:two-component system LytT family response regulator
VTLRAYLADDEPLALKRLARLLAETGRFEIVGSATDPETALEFLSRERVDVLFLDIEMPGMNGFELLARLAEQPAVVFTTAFDRYALRAFEVNAIDYLLKPIERDRLDRAIRKLGRLEGARPEWMRQPDLHGVLERLAASLKPQEPPMDRIASRVGERVQFIDLARITHFFAEDKLTFAATAAKNYCVDYTIAELERRLASRNFLRIHRSTLLNLDWVQEVSSWFAGGVLVRLKDDKHTELPVARDRVRALKNRLGF